MPLSVQLDKEEAEEILQALGPHHLNLRLIERGFRTSGAGKWEQLYAARAERVAAICAAFKSVLHPTNK